MRGMNLHNVRHRLLARPLAYIGHGSKITAVCNVLATLVEREGERAVPPLLDVIVEALFTSA